MTDQKRVEDAKGRALHVGDLVDIVHGGEQHRLRITRIEPHPEGGAATVEGDITVRVHAAGTHRITEERAPEASTATGAPQHTAQQRPSSTHGGRTR